MKAWIVSLCLFILLIGIIIGNAVYVHRVADHLCSTLHALHFEDAKTAATLEELDAYWQRHHPFISLSISYRELDHVSETMISLRAAYDTQNVSDFEGYRQLLLDAADELSRLERFSVENLF